MKDISQTLANFKKDTVHYGGPRRTHEEEPTRDPDVWPPPTPVERDNRQVTVTVVGSMQTLIVSVFSNNYTYM